MKWLITADWQAKFSNLDACKRAHEQELNIIAKHKVEGHIDLGDLKDDFNPVDVNVVKFQQERKEAIHQAVVHDITLLGNHDMLGQYAADKNWFSLFDSISGHNIKTPQILQLGNCIFSCLPFRRSSSKIMEYADKLYKEQLNIKKYNGTLRRILLFHCDVKGAKWNNLVPFASESKITLKALHTKYYDRVFGGHIHKHQMLSDNTMYVGNPFATDAGEIDQIKGFIVYDDETNQCTRIRSVVPGIFSWAYVQANKPKLVPGTKIKATIDCSITDNYHKTLDKVASRIESKYPECVAYVTPKFKIAETKETVSIDPDSSDYDKIAQYIRATIPEELLKKRKALISYVATILGNSTTSGIRQSGKIIFDSVYAQNVLSYQKVKFSFRNRGIILVKGKNKDWDGHSNGAGKTNLLSLIPIAISGRTFKDQKNDQWAIDSGEKKSFVNLQMLDDANRKLNIIRGRRPTRLKFKINDSDESTGRRHVGKKETQGLIEETIGYNFDTLANSVYIDSSFSNAFLTGTTADRAKLIHQFQNMDRFKLAKDKIGKEISVTNKQYIETESQKDICQELIQATDKSIRNAQQRDKENVSSIKAQKDDARQTKLTLKKSFRQLNNTYKGMKAKVDKKLSPLEKSLDKVSSAISITKAAMRSKEEEYDSFKNLGKLKKCPQCASELTEEHKQIVLARLKKAAGAKRTELKKLATSQIFLDKERMLLIAPLEGVKKEVDKIEVLESEAHYKYEVIKDSYEKVLLSSKKETKDIRSLKQHKRKLVRRLHNADKALVHITKDLVFLKYAQEAMSRDGLPAFLNKLLCPLLNRAAEKYSEIFIDKEIQVLFDIEDGHIVPSVINTHGGKSISSQSTGEKAWASIITSFALREIAHPTNLLVLDEPGNGLDKESAKMFGKRLSRLKDRFETIMVVSHNEDICAALDGDNSITVVKQNKISKLIQ